MSAILLLYQKNKLIATYVAIAITNYKNES